MGSEKVDSTNSVSLFTGDAIRYIFRMHFNVVQSCFLVTSFSMSGFPLFRENQMLP